MSYTLAYKGAEIDEILGRAATGGALDTAIAAKQDALTFDDAPTSGSDNPVKSGGIYDAIQAGGATALAAFATDSVSGDVVSFPDGADGIPVKAFTGSIIPAQSGSGDPAPDNVRPISGWTGANITRAGKNLLDPSASWTQGSAYRYINGVVPKPQLARITFTDKDTTVDVSSVSLGFVYENMGVTTPKNYRWVMQNGSIKSDTTNVPNVGDTSLFCANLMIYPRTAAAVSAVFSRWNIMLELGSTATAFEPYIAPNIITLSFGDTVYAGTLTALGGGLWQVQPTHAIYTVTGAEAEWTDYSPNVQLNKNVLSGRVGGTSITGFCSMVETTGTGRLSNTMIQANSSAGTYLRCIGVIGATAWGQSFADLAAWKTWLATMYANGTPLQVCYELADASKPDPITITGEDLQTLLGANTVWTDCGSVTGMTYRADTALYIDKKLGA